MKTRTKTRTEAIDLSTKYWRNFSRCTIMLADSSSLFSCSTGPGVKRPRALCQFKASLLVFVFIKNGLWLCQSILVSPFYLRSHEEGTVHSVYPAYYSFLQILDDWADNPGDIDHLQLDKNQKVPANEQQQQIYHDLQDFVSQVSPHLSNQ